MSGYQAENQTSAQDPRRAHRPLHFSRSDGHTIQIARNGSSPPAVLSADPQPSNLDPIHSQQLEDVDKPLPQAPINNPSNDRLRGPEASVNALFGLRGSKHAVTRGGSLLAELNLVFDIPNIYSYKRWNSKDFQTAMSSYNIAVVFLAVRDKIGFQAKSTKDMVCPAKLLADFTREIPTTSSILGPLSLLWNLPCNLQDGSTDCYHLQFAFLMELLNDRCAGGSTTQSLRSVYEEYIMRGFWKWYTSSDIPRWAEKYGDKWPGTNDNGPGDLKQKIIILSIYLLCWAEAAELRFIPALLYFVVWSVKLFYCSPTRYPLQSGWFSDFISKIRHFIQTHGYKIVDGKIIKGRVDSYVELNKRFNLFQTFNGIQQIILKTQVHLRIYSNNLETVLTNAAKIDWSTSFNLKHEKPRKPPGGSIESSLRSIASSIRPTKILPMPPGPSYPVDVDMDVAKPEPGMDKQAGGEHGKKPSSQLNNSYQDENHVDVPLNLSMMLRDQAQAFLLQALQNADQKRLLIQLPQDEAQQLVNFIGKLLNDPNTLTGSQRKSIMRLLAKISKSTQVFPQWLEISDPAIEFDLASPAAEGGFGTVYRGMMGPYPVCIKVPRIYEKNCNRRRLRAHAGELIVWAHLSHQNILPFFGISFSPEQIPRACIVSPWVENGDLLQYLKKFPDVPIVPILYDIACGLQYLHGLDIVHADLKAKNVLISHERRAMLTDFGVSRISSTLTTTTAPISGTPNWMAPELFEDGATATLESDVWAFGCTCYEVLTAGTMPFAQFRNPAQLIHAFQRRDVVPTKPELGWIRWDTSKEAIWELSEQCWDYNPNQRPICHILVGVMTGLNTQDERAPNPVYVKPNIPDTMINYPRVQNILYNIHQTGCSTPEISDESIDLYS